MVVQNEETEKSCCFYVSDFHLEMILVPYINKKIEENITILTEKNLKDSLEVVISKMNLKEQDKQKILQLEWGGEEKIKENSNVIIIGSNEYIQEKNREIEKSNPISIVDCYNFEENNQINDISNKYKNSLNTLGKISF